MKYSELKIIAQKLSNYRKFYTVKRVADTVLMVVFDKSHSYYFDLNRGDSYIYINEKQKGIKNYNAPFDVVLKKRFTNSIIERVEVEEGNKILKFHTLSQGGYKAQKSILQLEFTGRHTNIIILDENNTILEALRHIDRSNSFREIKSGIKLLPLPPKEQKEEKVEIDDIEEFLQEEYQKREERKLKSLKKEKILQLEKKREKIKKRMDELSSEEELQAKAKKIELDASLLLSKLYEIESYKREIEIEDFEGTKRTISLPKEAKSASHGVDILFSKAKKLKQKAKNQYIQRENLKEKIEFIEKMMSIIKSAKSSEEIELMMPKQPKQQKRRQKRDTNIENFYFLGYKISLGKNEKGNIELLKSAKRSDIWLHLKDMPSTHVIIRTNKNKIDDEVLSFAAKLCVDFSIKERGEYRVDYTKRGDVKIKDGANVNYVNHKSITIVKE